MFKIRKISFINHPILGNLTLDFCDMNGNAVDTVIFAGENGTGKSTVIEELYALVSRQVKNDRELQADVEFEKNGRPIVVKYKIETMRSGNTLLYAKDSGGLSRWIESVDFKNKYPTSGIYSDVDISFNAKPISSVTSLTLDEKNESRKSSSDLPNQINQLLIDIQAIDDAEVANAYRQNRIKENGNLDIVERMPRFTVAFNKVFDELSYSKVSTKNGQKEIIFIKNGIEIPINALSSGEKQVVYRGCFLLKDVNALNGAFVFIDEPEISLHPKWQMKIMEYYKGIFTNEKGIQTSQIFVVTHSPFIIHNNNRKNDKVIVLARDENGNIVVNDKPEYYKCNSMDVVQDAFSISTFSVDKPTVYLEGRTDERYFNKAIEVFDFSVPFQFKWVGHLNQKGDEVNTGSSALNQAFNFLAGRNLLIKSVCLFDCDTNRKEEQSNNAYTKVMQQYKNSKGMKKGIENALVLDDIDTNHFYSSKTKYGDYGDSKIINDFRKMEFCDYICSLDVETLKVIFSNLKTVITELEKLFEEKSP